MMTPEIILDIASSLGLLGLVGSFAVAYWKYWRRQKDRRDSLKRAIFTELLSTHHLDRAYVAAVADESKDHQIELEVDQEGVPVNQFLSTDIGMSRYDDFGLLTDEDIEDVVAYYSEFNVLKDVIQSRQTFEMSMKSGHGEVTEQMGGIVAGEIKSVKEKRDTLLRNWCSEFGYTREDLKQEHDIYIDEE